MQQPKLLLFCLLLVIVAGARAQSIKPKFKSLVYANYETEGKKAIIKDLANIDENGLVHFKSVWYDGIADTTYQLAGDKIEQLNRFFNGTHSLKSFMERTKLAEGLHFGGSYSYVSYVSANNITESLTVVSPFMSNEFNEALQSVIISPSKIKYKGKVIMNPTLSTQILLSEKRAGYLPKIEEPPTVKELNVNK